MCDWDSEGTRKRFEAIALDARHSMEAVAKGIWLLQSSRSNSAALKELHDAFLAKWSVYESLARSSCLETREELIADATTRRVSGPGPRPPGAFDEGNFRKHWRLCMQAVITEYRAERPTV
jgi:hypothetical protein